MTLIPLVTKACKLGEVCVCSLCAPSIEQMTRRSFVRPWLPEISRHDQRVSLRAELEHPENLFSSEFTT
jgi:hypothetical protein